MKPLHVRVAEALGAHCHYTKPTDPCGACGNEGPHGGWEVTGWGHGADFDPIAFDNDVPRYDTDWSATGPLIEKYGISLTGPPPSEPGSQWVAYVEDDHEAQSGNRSPLIAVCNLILALKGAGKL